MSRLSRSTATTPPKRLVTDSNRTSGRTPGSAHGANPRRMKSLARSVAGPLDGERGPIDQPVFCLPSRKFVVRIRAGTFPIPIRRRGLAAGRRKAGAAPGMTAAIRHIQTSTLGVAYEESGRPDGAPIFLMHGWPYDPRCYDEVIPPLAAAGCRLIVPYLRG